jgi:hypothetical protein
MHGAEVGKGVRCGKATPRQSMSGILRGRRIKEAWVSKKYSLEAAGTCGRLQDLVGGGKISWEVAGTRRRLQDLVGGCRFLWESQQIAFSGRQRGAHQCRALKLGT